MESRGQWLSRAKDEIQIQVDELGSGLEVLNVFLKDLHPPRNIAGSFEEVIAASQTKQKLINRAREYGYTHLPAARGDAYKQVSEASAYVLDKTRKAEGESSRFLMRLAQYKTAEGINRKLLYLNAIMKSLADSKKVVLDPDSGVSDVLLTGGQLNPQVVGSDW